MLYKTIVVAVAINFLEKAQTGDISHYNTSSSSD